MRSFRTRSRGTTAVLHWAEDFGNDRSLCGRHRVEAGLPDGAVVSATRPCPSCEARRRDAELREAAAQERRSRGTWNSRNRQTGKLETILIADMVDSHLISAIALCRRRAIEFGFIGRAEADAFIRRRWPTYGSLCVEAQRRFADDWHTMVLARIHRDEEPSPAPAGTGGRPGVKRGIRIRQEEPD